MRKDLVLETLDGYKIFGTLDFNDNNTLLIFVHGFTGHKDEHHYFNAASFFIHNGFDTFRFDFYARRKIDARPLAESSISTHVKDLKVITDHFQDKYDRLILIGHSLGPLIILSTDLSNISKLVLWDPTTAFKSIKEKSATFDKGLDKYIFHWGIDFFVSKEMIEEWMSIDLNLLLEKLSVPCKIIFAGGYNKYDLWKPYLVKFKEKLEFTTIDGATHGFIEEGVEEKLFEETLKFIKQ